MAELTALKCPCCDAPLTAPEGRGQFYCQFCGTPVSVLREKESEERASDKPVSIPEKLQVQEFGNELRISWKWFSWAVLFLVPFCLAWNSFLVGWYSMALADDGPPGGMKIIMILFPIAHVAVGVGLLYFCLVLLVNRTTVRIAHGQLTLRHGPIPALGNRTIAADDIAQIHVRHDRVKGRDGDMQHTYPLAVVMKSGQEIKLLPRNTEADVARAVEQLVEDHLGIEDQPDD